jgi:Superinfection immunity protein
MNDLFTLLWLILLIVGIAWILLLPTFIARLRRCKSLGFIFLVNILGVWIGIGWFIAMAWAIFGDSDKV